MFFSTTETRPWYRSVARSAEPAEGKGDHREASEAKNGSDHAGSVPDVSSGSIRSYSSAAGPVQVYNSGESFFDPPLSTHLTSENAGSGEPAGLLAIFAADDDAKLARPATPHESKSIEEDGNEPRHH